MKKFLTFVFMFLIFCSLGVRGINFYKNDDISSESVYVVNKNSTMPIIEKNTKQRRSPASLTKIMTYIVACENIKLIDPETRYCMRIDRIPYDMIMNVSDILQGLFEYD